MDDGTVPEGTTLTTVKDPVKLNLDIGEQYFLADFGFGGTSSVCGFVWIDQNKDGHKGQGEKGIAGTTVNLLWSGLDEMFGTTDDVTLTTITDKDGKYCFTNLLSGNYRILVDQSGFPNSRVTYEYPDFVLATDETIDNANLGFYFIPVGGVTMAINKIELLTPWIILSGLAATITLLVRFRRKR